MYVKWIASGNLLSSTELGALWQPKGVRWGRGFKRERTFVYQCLLHADVWQKPTQHCKAIILQLKRNKIVKKNHPPLPHCIHGEAETQRRVKTSLRPHREEMAEPDQGLRAPGSNQGLSSPCCERRNLCNQAAPPEVFPSGGSQRGHHSEIRRTLHLGLGPLIWTQACKLCSTKAGRTHTRCVSVLSQQGASSRRNCILPGPPWPLSCVL